MMFKTIINRSAIFIDAVVCNVINKFKRKKDSLAILIVFQQVFGDAVVISDSLKEYAKLYPKENGYQVKYLAQPSVMAFMQEVLFLPNNIEYETIDFKGFVEDYAYYKKVRKKYRTVADIIIVPGTSLSAEIFSTMCASKRRIGLVRSIPVRWPPVMVLFQKLAYTEVVTPDKELMMLQRHRLLLDYLGDKEYKAVLPKLKIQERFIEQNNYCVICPGASKKEKCWPTDRFIEIIDYLVKMYDMDIHLCGGSDEIAYEKIILDGVHEPERVFSHIGKTTFKEWSSIVQYADLVVGNDSATMHLAAASNIKSICIAGVYDKFQFFPYKVDYLKEKENIPITIIHDMPCAWCRTRGYYSGYQNDECRKAILSGNCSLCVEKIDVNEVMSIIDEELMEQKYEIRKCT